MIKNKVLLNKRVIRELKNIFDYPLVVINAPIGYGKTTTVKKFLFYEKVKYIYLSLPAVESDEYFWNKLTDEIYSFDPDLSSRLKCLGFPRENVEIARVLDSIALKKILKKMVFIIDDYQNIENPSKNSLITSISQEKIPNLHLVLISRSHPDIPIVEMITKNIAYRIDRSIFEFNKDEIREYFQLAGFKTNEKTLNDIYTRTGGWITAIYLFMLSSKKELNFNLDYSLENLLKTSFWNVYDKKIRTLLYKLSIFDSFTIEQAVFVLEDKTISKSIEALYLENTFITQEGNETFKFHPIFFEFLRKRYCEFDIDLIPLYSRAGEWYADSGDYEMAFKYLNRAKEFDAILAKLELPDIGHYAWDIDYKLICNIFEQIDKSLTYKYPMATLKYVFLLCRNSNMEKGKLILNDLTNFFSDNKHEKYTKERINAEITLVSTNFVFNDIEKMIEYHKKVQKLLDGELTLNRSRNDLITVGSPHFSYIYFKTKGAYLKVVQILSTQLKYFIQFSGGCGTGCGYLALAEYFLETGDLAKAELNAYKSIDRAKIFNQFDVMIGANFTLARIYTYQGRYEDGLALLDKLSLEIGNHSNTFIHNMIDLCYGYLGACFSEYKKIPEWIHCGNMPVSRFQDQGVAFQYIVYGKAKLLTGNYSELETLTEYSEDQFKVFNNQLGLIHNYIHRAIAKYNLYGLKEAVIELNKALEIGIADNIVMPFVENAVHLLPVIKSSLLNPTNEYYQKIVSMCEYYIAITRNRNKHSTILTNREIEVLHYLANGESQKEMAEKLCISQNTVRRHLQNIYTKLDAENKTIAVKKAREMNIYFQ